MRFVGNIGLAVVLATAVAGTAVAIAASWGGAYFLPGALAGTLAGAAALMRLRGRVRAAVAGLSVAAVAVVAAEVAELPAEPGPATAIALAVLVGSVTRVAPVRVVAAVAVAGLVVVAAGGLTFTRSGSSGAFAVTTFGLLAWAGGVLTGGALRLLDARRLAAVAAVRRDERLTIARELHDVVAHHVTGIVVQAQAAQLVARKDPVKAGESFAGIEAAGAEALAAVRRVVGLLRDDDGADAGARAVSTGPERIADLVRRFEHVGPAVHLQLPPHEDRWPAEVTAAVHRIVQEALTNVARHAAHAGRVSVTLSEVDGVVTVLVTDDGEAGPPGVHSGYGIVGMRERVEALGGTLSAGPGPGGGWRVHGTLPLPAAGAGVR